MKIAKKHYSNFLISVHFERSLSSEKFEGKHEQAKSFLYELGCMARKIGKRLHATYSLVSGNNGMHAHFAVSWLPLYRGSLKTAKSRNKSIMRMDVIRLLERNNFYVDNPSQAIKRITHDKKYVTDYVNFQPKDSQFVFLAGFYIHDDFVPCHSEIKIQSYCSKSQFVNIGNVNKKGCLQRQYILLLISLLSIILISYLSLLLF